ncbi:hypothetical protein AB0D65_29690 [Streptomyces griseoloalbus]|uniref:Uncharacterized protein n=1 Tax=Streptomyces griseoloalbus TaxID=67303 RepID=A0ABV3ED33_9ACTN
MKPNEPSRVFRLGELAWDLSVAALLWGLFSPINAVVFFGLARLWSVRRPCFLNLGRFTVGVCVGPRVKFLFGVAFIRYGERGPINGFEILILRHSLMVCTLLSRDEWRAFQRRKAERRAALEKGGGA